MFEAIMSLIIALLVFVFTYPYVGENPQSMLTHSSIKKKKKITGKLLMEKCK